MKNQFEFTYNDYRLRIVCSFLILLSPLVFYLMPDLHENHTEINLNSKYRIQYSDIKEIRSMNYHGGGLGKGETWNIYVQAIKNFMEALEQKVSEHNLQK